MELSLYQVDAFATQLFEGNPAAVCLLPHWLDDSTLQCIATENNLSETAFLVKTDAGWDLRWFTPTLEVDLCGHATLAAAYVLFEEVGVTGEIVFSTKSGPLKVVREADLLCMDFPGLPPEALINDDALISALGGALQTLSPIRSIHGRRYFLATYEKEEEIARLRPDFYKLKNLEANVICTSPGEHVDFVSRFFAPASGVDEDPVTGSAHCTLAPFWAGKLGKQRLIGRQISPRGGTVFCQIVGDRVRLSGECQLYLRGRIMVSRAL